jgi:hypothetical protein
MLEPSRFSKKADLTPQGGYRIAAFRGAHK